VNGTFPRDNQRKLGENVVKSIRFNIELGRVNESMHPLTTSFSLVPEIFALHRDSKRATGISVSLDWFIKLDMVRVSNCFLRRGKRVHDTHALFPLCCSHELQ
jgi:hypothetical protein